MALPTRPSTAAKGSSASTTWGLAYSALAIARRCCCPPDSVTPRSPISVLSPAIISFRSERSSARFTTSEYQARSKGSPITIFSRTVPLRMKAFWGT
mmetsp:Transcript_54482/g.125012  ORF Transcript_54482/g.125012 Transcript_54482/m.125012 type:complete len:97 (-) Transcript_54482:713-1003(-)